MKYRITKEFQYDYYEIQRYSGWLFGWNRVGGLYRSLPEAETALIGLLKMNREELIIKEYKVA